MWPFKNKLQERNKVQMVLDKCLNNEQAIDHVQQEVQSMHECMHNNLIHENDGNDLVQAIINLLVILVLLLTIIYYVKQWRNM